MAKNLTEATDALEAATMAYKASEEAYRAASRDHTNAINILNDAQKKFDAVIAEMKKAAPRDSDWNRTKGIRT